MKHRSQKQFYVVVVIIITAITSSNTWAYIIGVDWPDQTTQFLQFNLNENIATNSDSNLLEDTETQPEELVGRYRNLFIQSDNTTILSSTTNVVIDNSQRQIQASISARASIHLEKIRDEQNNLANNKTIGSDDIKLTYSGSQEKMALKSTETDYATNIQFRLPATAANRKTQETVVSAPAKLTLFGVGLIGIGLTRKKHNSSQEA